MKYFLIAIFIFSFNKFVYANNLFDTIFYNVEFTSKNIQNDKLEEINKIKIKSIQSIFKKTLINNHFKEVNNYINEDFVNTFIKNILINDEKIINDRYKSKIKINFDKTKIIDFYRKNKFSYVEFYPDKFLLIIYEKNELDENLFSKNNNFYNYLKSDLQKYNLFEIPNMDINDRFILKKNHVINRNLDKIYNFSKKYNSNDTIVVLALKNKNKINYQLVLYSDEAIIDKDLNFNKTDLDKFFKNLENETLNMWKKINQIQNSSLNLISCKVKYFNMLELKAIRNNLNNVSIIKDLYIKSLSYKNIYYDIYYYGNLKILLQLLRINNLKIDKYEDLCLIKL